MGLELQEGIVKHISLSCSGSLAGASGRSSTSDRCRNTFNLYRVYTSSEPILMIIYFKTNSHKKIGVKQLKRIMEFYTLLKIIYSAHYRIVHMNSLKTKMKLSACRNNQPIYIQLKDMKDIKYELLQSIIFQ